jgi:hypothetical protein
LYCAPVLLVLLLGGRWWEVLMVAIVDIGCGWTIFGWFIALGMARDISMQHVANPRGIPKLLVTLYLYWQKRRLVRAARPQAH